MNAEKCIQAIKAAGTDLTDTDVEEIVTKVLKRQKELKAANALASDADAFAKAAKSVAEEEKIAALIEKRSRAINVLRKQDRMGYYDSLAGKEVLALRAINVGAEGAAAGLGRSVDAQRLALEDSLLGPMVGELRRDDLLPLLQRRDPELDKDIAREMWRLTDPEQAATGNGKAAQIAAILNKYQEASRLMQNDAGAFIGKQIGYVTRQSHDQFRIAGKGTDADFVAWRDSILPKLHERTFAGIEDRNEYLRDVWTNLASGNHLKANGAADWLGGFKGPGNVAKRASQERSLHFKSADDWFSYNAQYGTNSLLESLARSLQHAARNTALMRTWGTNPEAAFTADREQLTLRAKERGDLKQVKKLNNWLTKAEFEQVNGTAQIADSPSLAMASQVARNILSMASLGGVVLSSIPDIAIRASTLRHNGVGFLESYSGAIRSIFEGRGAGETREIADTLNAGTNGILGGVLARFDATDNLNGRMTKIMQKFFDLNLLNWWTDAHKTGVGLALSRNLAFHKGKEFASLPDHLQTTLTRYGITADTWGMIRQSATKVADGQHYITPDAIRNLDDAAVRSYLGRPDATDKDVARAKFDLEVGLRSYFSDQIREAVTEAGARERAMVTLGTKPGTPAGEVLRFLGQFKTYPVSFMTRHLNREFRRDGRDGGGIAHLIVGTTLLGYVSMTAKDFVKGRSQRQVEDVGDAVKLLAAAMQQGGGLGIYGDFLFGQSNRFGQGLVETMAGPAAGRLSELKGVLDTIGKGDDPTAHAVRFGINSAPFVNLFWARPGLDWLVLYQIQETLNPGFLRRMERRIEQDNNQKFMIPPSSAIPYGGGDRLFEGVR